jgi:hypothetical protein
MPAQRQRQPIKRDPAAQMMDVMHADIGREPAQHDRQIVVRTAVQRRLVQIPFLVGRPERILELVLNVEQPDPERSADRCRRRRAGRLRE